MIDFIFGLVIGILLALVIKDRKNPNIKQPISKLKRP